MLGSSSTKVHVTRCRTDASLFLIVAAVFGIRYGVSIFVSECENTLKVKAGTRWKQLAVVNGKNRKPGFGGGLTTLQNKNKEKTIYEPRR